MVWPILALIPIAIAVSAPVCWLMLRLGHRLGAHDTEPMPGQTKMPRRAIPNTGGVGIFLGLALPMVIGLGVALLGPGERLADALPPLGPHLEGIRERLPMAAALLAALLVLHVVGAIDDRRPLGPWLKLGAILVPAGVLAGVFDTRLLELLDGHVGGPWLSIAITVLWFGVVTNAMNFMDNMDGLSAGTASVAGGIFLAAALVNGQWFVAAVLALLVGACLGFLVFNVAPARLFMGDSGSLVIGFALAFLTVRTTYVDTTGSDVPPSGAWYGVLMPVVVLAVPLYDFASVTLIRLGQGSSPFVGDLQHFSHRLVRRGLSKRDAVAVIWGFTAATGAGGIVLGSVAPWQAILIGVQTVVILLVLALFERASTPAPGRHADLDRPD